MAKAKGSQKTGGRKKGSPNKITVAVKDCFKKLIEDYTNSQTFMSDFASLEPKDRLMLVEKLSSYVVPKMQSVAVEDVNKDKNSTVSMLIQLRDGRTSSIPNLVDDESSADVEEED